MIFLIDGDGRRKGEQDAYGDVPVSLMLVHSAPGAGPAVRRHPYAEVFADIPHGFTNTGSGELRLTAIHCAPAFKTDWVAAPDPQWASPPKVGG
jgi:hypothetical protein